MVCPSMLVLWCLCSAAKARRGRLDWEVQRQKRGGFGVGGPGASTVALQERGCHGDGDQKGEGACVQRDAFSGDVCGVGRTAVGVCGHGGGVRVGVGGVR